MARFERETEILLEDKDAENTEKVSESIDKCFRSTSRKRKLQNRIKDSVSARFKNVLRYCVLHCCFVFYLRLQCLIKQLLNSVFRDIQNYQGLGKCNKPQPSASADNTYLTIDNCGYHEKPHPIIVYNCERARCMGDIDLGL